jgi:hypothetical protein
MEQPADVTMVAISNIRESKTTRRIIYMQKANNITAMEVCMFDIWLQCLLLLLNKLYAHCWYLLDNGPKYSHWICMSKFSHHAAKLLQIFLGQPL